MKNALDKKGLSLSQAQTISNLANQAATDMLARLSMTNNVRKMVNFKGKDMIQVDARPLPTDLESQLKEIGNYRALQAFLMEQLKAKESLLTEAQNKPFSHEIEAPEKPVQEVFNAKIAVKEAWGWDQLSIDDLTKYWEAEAHAAVLGQFIHKNGTLDKLRKELPNIVSLEWFVAPGHQGEAYPITVQIHENHTDEKLWEIHQLLSNQHREFEQKVNYYKAKVKNLVTQENARIAADNGTKQAEVNKANIDLRNEYTNKVEKFNGLVKEAQQKFEKERQEEIQKVAALKIRIDPRFQKLVDELMPKESKSDDTETGEEQ